MQPDEGRGLRRAAVATLLLLGLAGAATAQDAKSAPPALDGSLLQPANITYVFSMDGNPGGTSTLTLAREGDVWVATQVMQSDMFSSQSEARMQGADLAAVSYKRTMTGGDRTMTTDLKVENGKIVGTAAGFQGDQTVDVAATAGTLLPETDVFALTVLPLQAGQTVTLPVFSARSGAVENVEYKVDGVESVTVPAGTFDAYKVEAGGDQAATLWLRKDAPHVLLKRQMQQFPVVVEAKSLQ